MYGDTGVMRRRASQLRQQGADVRRQADQLVSQMDAIAWTGRAADAMRERIRDRASQLHHVASRHDRAAESLELHVRAVESLKDQIATVQRRAEILSDEDRVLAGFAPPPSGHQDWLTVELPGI